MQEKKRIRILTVFAHPWDDRTNIGNTFSNILGGQEYELAQVYCMAGIPNSNVCNFFYQIKEKDILKNIFNKNHKTGRKIYKSSTLLFPNKSTSVYDRVILKIKDYRFVFLFWMRDLIWAFDNWKSTELNEFVEEFNPDIIFYNIDSSVYLNRLTLYLNSISKAKLVGYIWDDIYTFKQVSISPLWWIKRTIDRLYIRRVIKGCSKLYAISEQLKNEYDTVFNKEFSILRKGTNIARLRCGYQLNNFPLKIVYNGNIYSGRYKTLKYIAKAIEKLNKDNCYFHLYISTGNKITNTIRKQIEVPGASTILGNLSIEQIKKQQIGADILLNVDPFSIFDRYKWRLSFSTKIVDYLEAGRCILSVAWIGIAGHRYLQENDTAIIIEKKEDILNTLLKIVENPDIVVQCSIKSSQLAMKNHDLNKIRADLKYDFQQLIK